MALLNPIENPDLKLAIVMLIVPFFVNVSALLHFLTSVCSMPSCVPFKIVTEKTPYSTWVPPCKYLSTLIPTPDLETSRLLPQHEDPAPGPLCKLEGPGIFVLPSLPGNCHLCNSGF